MATMVATVEWLWSCRVAVMEVTYGYSGGMMAMLG